MTPKVPYTCTRKSASSSAWLAVSKLNERSAPALLTSKVTSPACFAAAAICSGFVTSSRMGITRGSRARTVPSSLAAAYTLAAPASSSADTSAWPRPRFAPVTRAMLPWTFMTVLLLLSSRPCERPASSDLLARPGLGIGLALAGRDQAAQAVADVEAPAGRARLEAIEPGHQAHVGEAKLGLVPLGRDVEADLGADPLPAVLRVQELGVEGAPDDALSGHRRGDPMSGTVQIAVAVGELVTHLRGAALEVLRL